MSIVNTAELRNLSLSDPNGRAREVPGLTLQLRGVASLLKVSLAFVTFSSSSSFFTLSVVAGGEVIWSANRNDPVPEKARLHLSAHGNLLLQHPHGRIVWSSNTSNQGVVSMAFSPSSPCLTLFTSTNSTLWNSCDYFTDTLFIPQFLLFSQPNRRKLISRASPTDLSQGPYSFVAEPGGVALYANFGAQEPYWIWSLLDRNNTFSITHTCNTVVAFQMYASSRPSLFFRMFPLTLSSPSPDIFSPKLCTTSGGIGARTFNIHVAKASALYGFLRLEYNGRLKIYAYDSTGWEPIFDLFEEEWWHLPSPCGAYGIIQHLSSVTNTTKCTGCPLDPEGVSYRTDSGAGQHCRPANVPSCNSNASDWTMITLPGVDYFPNQYKMPSHQPLQQQECMDLCRTNCSCAASFYWKDAKSCFLTTSELGSLLNNSNANRLAFVKVAREDLVSYPVPKQKLAAKSKMLKLITIVTSVSGMLILSTLLFFSWKKLRRRDVAANEDDLETSKIKGLMKFSYSMLEAATNGFAETLGEGAFGAVYKGVLPDGREVAVKRLDGMTGQRQKEFLAEIASLEGVRHWNLVELFGYCAEGSHRLLVYEYMANGSLDDWLFDEEKEHHLNWPALYKIALAIARALAYLHEECKNRVIHFDIKPANVLLNEKFVAKISDFGLARLVRRDQTVLLTTMKGTPGYVAPEFFAGSPVSDKSDVYSYGMVLLEMIGGRRNYMPYGESQLEKSYFPAWALQMALEGKEMEIIDERLSSFADEDQVRLMIRVAFLCIQESPKARPSMRNVVHMLEELADVPDIALLQGLRDALKARERLAGACRHATSSYHSNSLPDDVNEIRQPTPSLNGR